jgi:hypothetical protein
MCLLHGIGGTRVGGMSFAIVGRRAVVYNLGSGNDNDR